MTQVRTETRTTTARDSGVPAAVLAKRVEILRAAEAKDYDALEALIDAREFSYTFGGPVEGGPIEYWKQLALEGTDPLEALAAILELPYTLSRGVYVWPFAYDKTAEELTQYEAVLLKKIPPDGATVGPEGYLGWRAGIGPDGSWLFFVAGD